jgi:hypothetical protein
MYLLLSLLCFMYFLANTLSVIVLTYLKVRLNIAIIRAETVKYIIKLTLVLLLAFLCLSNISKISIKQLIAVLLFLHLTNSKNTTLIII